MANYIEPMVRVYQEYKTLSSYGQTAQLPPCVVGPCYHIIDPDEDEALALVGDYLESGFSGARFPNNYPGALIREDSVSFRLKNAMVLLHDDPLGVTSASMNSVASGDLAAASAAIAPKTGDYVQFRPDPSSGWLEAEYRVLGPGAAADTLLLNKSVPVTAGAQMRVLRKLDECVVPFDGSGVSIDETGEKFDLIGQRAELEGSLRPVIRAEAYVGYKALRQDLSQIGTYYTLDEIQGRLGKPVPENPLAFGAMIAMANSAEVGLLCIGVDSDDLAGYTGAKDRMETHDPLYAIVPLTMDPGVLSMFKNHAIAMSVPEIGMWRIALGCSPLTTTLDLADGEGKLSKDGDGDLVVLTSVTDSAFVSATVDAGDTIVLIDPITGDEYAYTVASVPAEDILSVTQAAPFDSAKFSEGATYAYRITRAIDKTAQARLIGSVSRAYGTHRFVHVWPDVCVVDGEELPGYYLACAVAGGIGSLPPHMGFTRLSLAGISGVKHSSDYFNKDQLNEIAGGGTFIMVQAAPTAPPHVRHQLTCDMSALEYQELSFVKNFDFVSYIGKSVLDSFIGKYNITQTTLGLIATAWAGQLEQLRLASQPKIGSPVLGYDITSVEQLATDRSRVELYSEIDFPYPLNTIGLHLISR